MLDFKRLEVILLDGKTVFPTCVAIEILCLNGTVEVDGFLLLKALSLLFELSYSYALSVVQVFCCLTVSLCPHLLVRLCSSVWDRKKAILKNRLQKQKLRG